jgi:hypothetical protein
VRVTDSKYPAPPKPNVPYGQMARNRGPYLVFLNRDESFLFKIGSKGIYVIDPNTINILHFIEIDIMAENMMQISEKKYLISVFGGEAVLLTQTFDDFTVTACNMNNLDVSILDIYPDHVISHDVLSSSIQAIHLGGNVMSLVETVEFDGIVTRAFAHKNYIYALIAKKDWKTDKSVALHILTFNLPNFTTTIPIGSKTWLQLSDLFISFI